MSAWNFIKKETQAQVFFCEFCEIFKSTDGVNTSGRLLLKTELINDAFVYDVTTNSNPNRSLEIRREWVHILRGKIGFEKLKNSIFFNHSYHYWEKIKKPKFPVGQMLCGVRVIEKVRAAANKLTGNWESILRCLFFLNIFLLTSSLFMLESRWS